MKKHFTTAVLILFFCAAVMAQVPQKIKYQGIARNLTGAPIINQNISLRVSILQDTTNGPSVYVETFALTTNGFGLFSVSIGTGTVVSGSFAAIAWGQHEYYEQVEMDPTGGNSYAYVGASQLVSVPYALYSENSGNCGFTNMQVFSASGSFTIPNNVRKIMVEVWGAGGGGGTFSYPSTESGGGGGGYGKEIFSVVPGTVYAVTVGYGGLGSTSTGGDGGSSSFGALISAGGGKGSHANGGAGGYSTAAFNIMGEDAYNNGGSDIWGGIGANGGVGGKSFTAGRQPGGGGGAGSPYNSPYSGGNGGQGRVVVWW